MEPNSSAIEFIDSLAIEFICPICQKLPQDPVFAEDGFIYCNRCIETVIEDDSNMAVSPMTEEPMGKTLIHSKVVKDTIRNLIDCEELDEDIRGSWSTEKLGKSTGNPILDETMKKANLGDVHHMVELACWYLFGEQDDLECDENQGYEWLRKAADEDHMEGKAYQGYCLLTGKGVERDWEEGYELLIEVASQESGAIGRDVAAYTLGCCYKRGVHGFRHDEKKADKWLSKVQSRPAHNMFGFANTVEKNATKDESQLEKEQLSRLGVPFPDVLASLEKYEDSCAFPRVLNENNNPKKNNLFEDDQWSQPSLPTATTGSTTKHSSCHPVGSENPSFAGNTSIDRNFDLTLRCTKCKAQLLNSSSQLCQKCKIVGHK